MLFALKDLFRVPEALGTMNVQVHLHRTGLPFHADVVSRPQAEQIHWASDVRPDLTACAARGLSAHKC